MTLAVLVGASCGDPVPEAEPPDVPTVSVSTADPVTSAAESESEVAPTDPPVETSTPADTDPPESSTSMPPSTTTAATSPTEPIPVNAFEVAVTSELPPSPSGDTYGPGNLVDGDLTTAWNHCGSECSGFVDDAARNGVGESIVVRFAQPTLLTGFSIANGYQKDDPAVFLQNNRVERMRVDFDDGTSVSFSLTDDRNVQEQFFEPRTVTALTLVVESVYLGDGTFNDLALSELSAWIIPT